MELLGPSPLEQQTFPREVQLLLFSYASLRDREEHVAREDPEE